MTDYNRIPYRDIAVIGVFYELTNLVARIQLMSDTETGDLLEMIRARSAPDVAGEHAAMHNFVDHLVKLANEWPDPKDYDSLDEYRKAFQEVCLKHSTPGTEDDVRPVD